MKSIYKFLTKKQKLSDIYPHVKKYSIRRLWFYVFYVGFRYTANSLIVIAAVTGFAYGWMTYGKTTVEPQIVSAKEIVEVPVTTFPPMLQKICNSEVTGDKSVTSHQFNKDGSVVRGKIDKSDIGYCQINERYNNDLARKLGYDIYTEKGNKDFAVYLFMTRGSEPWNASKATWSK